MTVKQCCSVEDLRYITMFPKVLSIDTTYGTNREKRLCWYFLEQTTTGKTSQRCVPSSLPNVSIAIPSLIGEATVERINQINTDSIPSPIVF
jgi:hypothetical protein